MRAEEFIRRASDELVQHHGAHTVLLYGSRADGSATEDSDYDLAAFGNTAAVFRDARLVEGSYLDAFLYPDSVLAAPTGQHLKLRGSRVLVQRDSLATTFLERLEDLYRRGPEPLPQDEAVARKAWAHKMLSRAERSDAEGDYRRAWLLTALLEDYFSLRREWFEGPKKALRWLAQFDQPTFEAFSLALKPGCDLRPVAVLVRLVVGAQDP